MIKENVEIINKLGLHARASTKFTQVANQFSSDIAVIRDEKRVNAKSIMGVMMLAAAKGSVIEIEANGADEVEAVAALKALVNNYFDESE
ncbi:MAG: HPr family phosphocarrier protein [Betaproteobacteria bacterium]|jgi:phosphocarrier protein HPr|nr:HPr family phosphocarrier protein [Betaproteobacteria bacterium]MCH9848707.1 HPr family phosphocarrier protein [Betaproteobacteria bacterium]MDG1454387.1 HPr family phosphocarrier protein [Methylophilaceae bacterium]